MAASSTPIQPDLNHRRELNQVLNQFKLCNCPEPGLELPRMHHWVHSVGAVQMDDDRCVAFWIDPFNLVVFMMPSFSQANLVNDGLWLAKCAM